jgi:hypothetical protein
MGSTRTHRAGVAAAALLGAGLLVPAVFAQGGQHSQREGVANSKAGDQTSSVSNLGPDGRSRSAATTVVEAEIAAPAPTAPVAAPSAGGGGSGSGSGSGSAPAPAPAPAPPVVVAPAPPAVASPGLSEDAPEVPPSLGVVDGSGAASGPSPSATPEPSTLLLMGTGLVGLYRLRKRQ